MAGGQTFWSPKRWLMGFSRKRLFRLVHAAKFVQNSSDPFRNVAMASALETTPLDLPSGAFASLKKVGLKEAALDCLRQRLVATLIYRQVIPQLLLHLHDPKARLSLGLPKAWRNKMALLGVSLSPVGSDAKWALWLVIFYLHGARSGLQVLKWSLLRRLPPAETSSYAVLMSLNKNNLPQRSAQPAYDFVSWYRASPMCSPEVRTVWTHLPKSGSTSRDQHGVRTPYFFPRLDGLAAHCRFAAVLLSLFAKTFLKWVRGEWWEVVLLEQRVHCEYARLLDPEDFARFYVFNSAHFALRPLWSYLAEAAGSSIDFCFYATNIETFGTSPLHPRPYWPGYQGMTWKRYGVWDSYQADLIHALGHRGEPTVVLGSVGFTDKDWPRQQIPRACVAVFDVTPQRIASLALRGIPQPYYTAALAIRFLEDVDEVLANEGLKMLYKKKREIGKISAAGYRRRLAATLNKDHVVAVDPDIAPQHLIAEALAVISMPFTSTALIGRSLRKPTVFYDPLGVLVGEYRLAHGIPVIGSKLELLAWLRSNVVSPMLVSDRMTEGVQPG